jgi:hypothetical protein
MKTFLTLHDVERVIFSVQRGVTLIRLITSDGQAMEINLFNWHGAQVVPTEAPYMEVLTGRMESENVSQ